MSSWSTAGVRFTRSRTRRVGFSVLWVAALFTACSGAPAPGPAPAPADSRPAAPWQGARLSAGEVPAAYSSAWSEAENRATCALVAFDSAPESANATARRATFSGGWGVAYDQPELRSAFGVAGTGVSAADPTYADWPHRIEWTDGSSAGYGPEGGSGPNQLAYLRIAGQDCLYNVWSRLGRTHLEGLLDALRIVDTP